MSLRKKKNLDIELPPPALALPAQAHIRLLRPLEHWQTVRHMYRNYPGVDTNFDQVLAGRLRRPFLRWLGMPLYFWLFNQGWGLWLADGQLAGQIYLQHRQMVTHINDIEVNQGFQSRGYSHTLLAVAEQQARLYHKSFLTLAVTLTNTRAVNLYRHSGFLDQHHRYFYLSHSGPGSSLNSARAEVQLLPLLPRPARRNLARFFEQEITAGKPATAPVWRALYRPELPGRGHGFSFGVQLGSRRVGHADFFDWDGRGRWRIYLDPELWGTPDEQAVFEALLHQARGYGQLGLMVGCQAHHNIARPLARNLGLIERDTERMLMIRPLTARQ